LVRIVAPTALLAIALGASEGQRAAGQTVAQPIAVIVNDSVPARELTRAAVRRFFLLRDHFWSSGERVAPVNLPAGSALREAFSHAVLGGGSRDFSLYWNDLYFHGTLPPPTVASEQAVVLYVTRTHGAIGYVSQATAAKLPDGVRVALTVEP